MNVLVTGHRGYVGGTLVPLLLDRGHRVTGVDADLFQACTFTGRLTAIPDVQKDIRDITAADLADVDAIIHLAGLSNDPLGEIDPKLTLDVNYRATVTLARMARKQGIRRFVFASSCSVYGAGGTDWLDESSALRPITPYAQSKLLAEQELRGLADEHFSPVFLRAATVYGVSPRLRFDLVLNNLVAWGRTTGRVHLKSDGSAWRPLVHVQDLGRAFVAALEAPAGVVRSRAFNVGRTVDNYRIRDLAALVEKEVPGARVERSTGASADRRSYRVRCDRIARELPEFQPTWTVEAGIAELLAAMDGHPLRPADFEGDRFGRKAHLLRLRRRGELDRDLRRAVVGVG